MVITTGMQHDAEMQYLQSSASLKCQYYKACNWLDYSGRELQIQNKPALFDADRGSTIHQL